MIRLGGKRWVVPALVVLMTATGVAGVGRAGTDPEPQVIYKQGTIDPGPGWPVGWKPPEVPVELLPSRVDLFNKANERRAPEQRLERLELRVLDPLPIWTKEYPYRWEYTFLVCGKTVYDFVTPALDTEAIWKAYKATYSMPGVELAPCQITPPYYITRDKDPDVDPEQERLYEQIALDMNYAQAGLQYGCAEETTNGTVNNIYVCFNEGDASRTFDAPAYADLTVGRVRVPLRFVSELMGAKVTWNQQEQSVTMEFPAVSREVAGPVPNSGYTMADIWQPETTMINSVAYKYGLRKVTQPARTIVVTLGKTTATVDGRAVQIDAPPVAVPPGRVMVPVRFVSETMGAKVYWVGKDPVFRASDGELGGTNQVHIYTPFYPFYEYPNWFLEHRAQKF